MNHIDKSIRNALIKTLIALILVGLPAQLYAAMGDYCLMPPYVKRDVKPNIMIMMDNAVDMGDPAYCQKDVNFVTNHYCGDNYTPRNLDGTVHIYSGYYQPTTRYRYASNRFVPDAAGIYSGNLLNWATTSKYDLLQSILVGGISASRQSNVNTLISKSNVWQKMLTYDNNDGLGLRRCIFNVNNANVEVTELNGGECGYLDSPAAHPLTLNDPAFASVELDTRFAMRTDQQYQNIEEPNFPNHPTNSSPGFWSTILSAVMDFLVPSAEAASQLRISGGPSSLPDGNECTPYDAVAISASGGTGQGYIWDVPSSGNLPPGMSMAPTGTPSTTITGIPTASGTYTFTVRVRDSSNNSDTKSYTITVQDATVTILTTSPLQDGYVGSYYYLYQDLAVTSRCSSFTWQITSGTPPPGLNFDASNYLELWGWPTTAGTYNFTVKVTDAGGNTASKALAVNINPTPSAGLVINTGSPLQNGTEQSYYFAYIMTQYAVPGTTYPFTWSITAGSLPPGMNFGYYGGDPLTNPWSYSWIYGTPNKATSGTYTFTVKVVDSFGQTATKQFSLTIAPSPNPPRSTGNLNVNACAGNYTYNCSTSLPVSSPPTSLDDWIAAGCSESNLTTCILKSGLVDKAWPTARFGVMDFNKASQAGQDYANPYIENCIEQNPGPQPDPNFLTAVENAVAIDPITTLVNGEYQAVNYYATGTGSCNPFTGAQSCVKNFILILTGGVGADNPTNPSYFLTPAVFNSGVPSACTSSALSNLAKDSCYGYNVGDIRSDVSGRQYVSTFVVNTMGTQSGSTYNVDTTPVTTGDILKQAAVKGGGIYYEVTDPATLKAQLEQALQDIIKRAAAGTAASVLASGEGSGANLIQAVFYPRKQFGNDEITWIGRLTNLWYYVDPRFANSAIREDDGDRILNLKTDSTHHDYITSLYFDGATETTKAKRWADTNGDGVVEGSALTPDIAFEDLGSLWEAGSLLWSRNLSTSPRTIYTSTTGTTLTNFSTASRSALSSYLTASTDSEAEAIIRWTQGEDTPFSPAIAPAFTPSPDYRHRAVSINGVGPYTWKLGDVLNSTPKISTWLPLSAYHKIYGDYTYGMPGEDPSLEIAADNSRFITSSGYKGRGMIFAGANDGMLHAFRLGTLRLKWSGQQNTEKARLTNTVCTLNHSVSCMTTADCTAVSAGSCTDTVTLGEEAWAFIPKNVLPYLKYMADANYGGCHLYTVDLTPYIFDASIGAPGSGDVSGVTRTGSHWRTILIGGMRYGGGCRNAGSTCTDCVKTPVTDLGYSSYFALDITNQNSPVLLWEYTNPELGFTTAGPAIVKISTLTSGTPDKFKNGKWFVVLPSGPTGPIDTASKQFLGRSDQPLKLLVLNLKDGSLAATIPTGIADAFAGSMYNATLDTDLDYQDDVVYVPYVEKATDGTWTDGGVGRLSTKEDLDPTHWVWSTVMDHIGPVTSAVTKLQNNATNTLWVFFGTGRYYFEQSGTTDDGAGQRQIFGVKEPCFSATGFDPNCTSNRTLSNLTNVTDVANVPANPDVSTFKGWYINLDGDAVPDATFRAERVITDPLATTSGVVYFTTYKPYSDECALGGKSFLWAVKYNSGDAPGTLLKGKAIIQVSTGSIEQLNLSDAFTDAGGRKSAGMEGVPPTAQGLSILTTPAPVKRVLHIRER